MKKNKKYVQISLPLELLEEIENDRESSLLSKSAWFVLAAKEKLRKNEKGRVKKVIDL